TSRLNPDGALGLGGVDSPGMGLVRAIGSFTPGSSALKAQLAQAGFHNTSAVAIYLGAKLILLAAGLALGAVAMLLLHLSLFNEILVATTLGGIAFFLPNYHRS